MPTHILQPTPGAADAIGTRHLPEQYFQTAIRLDPRWAAPYANLSCHFSWTGREDDALRIADQGLAVSHANPVVTRARALSLIRLRRPDESERDIRQLVATGAPMSGQDHLVLGSVALARGNPELAAREFETISARLPTTTSFLAIARAFGWRSARGGPGTSRSRGGARAFLRAVCSDDASFRPVSRQARVPHAADQVAEGGPAINNHAACPVAIDVAQGSPAILSTSNHAAIPENGSDQPFANPRTGTIHIEQSSVRRRERSRSHFACRSNTDFTST